MKEKPYVLVVDDDPNISRLVELYLKKENFEVKTAARGDDAVNEFHRLPPDLMLLDVMLPGMDGYQVLKTVRKSGTIPVIMLTAKSDETDELLGYNLGIDEYITKPFSPKILVARIDAILRRTNKLNEEDVITAGRLTINKTSHVVTVDGNEVELSFKEFELLCYFAENEGIALSREKILNNVWNYDYFGDARTIDTHVKKIRSKLGDCGDYIKTIWGMGYKFEADE